MVTPVRDGAEMVRQMRPERVPGAWRFVSVSETEVLGHLASVRALFREDEGYSLLIPAEADAPDAMAQITLQVFSALDGVGLTAAVSATLAEADIPCNVIAATHHDHIFVPVAMADRAVALLQARAAAEAV